jgi:uncharacterized membrane protein YfhO
MEWMTNKFFIRFFLWLIIVTIVLKLCGINYISDALVLGMMGYIVALITCNNVEKKWKTK